MKHSTRTDTGKGRAPAREVACFRAVRVGDGFDPAVEFVVCPWGTVQTRKGPVTVNERTLQVFEANQAKARRDKVAGDFAHNLFLAGVKDHPVNVAGYFSVKVERDRGIVARLLHGTPHLNAVKDGSYPDISPAVERDAAGVVEGLHSFAFCPHGEMDHPDLEIFLASDGREQPKTQDTMDDATMLAELLSALTGEEIAADATPEVKAAALAKAKGSLAAKKESAEPMSAEITALSAELKSLKTEIAAFKSADGTRAVDALIADATRAGKKVGLSRDRLVAMGADGAKEYLDTLDAGVVRTNPNKAVAAAAEGKTAKPADVFSADALAMFKRNGVDAEEMLKKHQARAAAGEDSGESAGDE